MQKRKAADQSLRLYQRLSLVYLFPPLMSFFSAVVALWNSGYAQGLSLNVAVYGAEKLKGTSGYIAFVLVVGLGLVGLGVFLTLRAAKGKLYAPILGTALYLADLIFGLILYRDSIDSTYFIRLICHGVFLLLMAASIFFYFQTEKRLKAEKRP
jgi:hypothetical protein